MDEDHDLLDTDECDGCGNTFAAWDLNMVELADGYRSRTLRCDKCVRRVSLAPPEDA